ncbi:hypothetical protein QX776_06535 [Alteromonadaceae bacterium BrNp21-10]|nr:hypothetical protein [Alteromonadaceae bacterium BrNp21-10]
MKESNYVRSVKTLVTKIHGRSVLADSLYEMAEEYFKKQAKVEEQRLQLQHQINTTKKSLGSEEGKKQAKIEAYLETQNKTLKKFEQDQLLRRLERQQHLQQICLEILALSEDENNQETQLKSAKLLGTLFMMTPEQGRKVPLQNMFSKHLYKAVLSLRLLDQLLVNDNVIDTFVTSRLVDPAESSGDGAKYTRFDLEVKIPMLMAALAQDIGRMHPDAQRILFGESGNEDEFRVLDPVDRVNLLKLTYQQGLAFITDGIGMPNYVGNSKSERQSFYKNEQAKLDFTLKLIKNAVNPKNGIGNVLKIPQVYTSVVLSTKSNQAIEYIPKVAMMLRSGAEKKLFSTTATEALLQITGLFPQGFGLSYIPKEFELRDIDRFEYAIVSRLYPNKQDEPICRKVTRNMEYHARGNDCVISKNYNLYFPPARKALQVVKKERLLEILKQLVSNFEERKDQDLLPRCWHPYHYFEQAKFQNLWNKMTITRN